MELFGSVWGPTGGRRPLGLMVNFFTGKLEFFMGDRWITVGPVFLVQDSNGTRPVLPNRDKFFADREALNDGTDVWKQWGVRVN